MGVFFGFGDVQLGFVMFGQVFVEDVGQWFWWEGVGCWDVCCVLGQYDEICQLWGLFVGEFIECWFDEGVVQFVGVVGVEVYEDYCVVIFDLYCFGVGWDYCGGFDEFVVFVVGIGGFEGCY